MSRYVIAAYTPKPGKERQLLAALAKHHGLLRAENLITAMAPVLMRAVDGTLLEVFEWHSTDAIAQAHASPAVQELWNEFGAACEYTPLARLSEAQRPFAEFEAVGR
jgi:quinol monooxygenase YgiN